MSDDERRAVASMRDDERKAIASMSDDERKASLVSSMSLQLHASIATDQRIHRG